MLSLETPVSDLRMIGPIYHQRLNKLGITTIGDLLHHIPFRYDDLSKITNTKSIHLDDVITIIGKVLSIKNIFTKYGKNIQIASISDETGTIDVLWYNQPFLVNILSQGTRISIAGKVEEKDKRLILISPEYEIIKDKQDNSYSHLIHTGRLVPIYNETQGLSSKWIRSRIHSILFKLFIDIQEFLPEEIIEQNNLVNEKEAILKIHFPQSLIEADEAKKRLSFDELLILQLSSILRRNQWNKKKANFVLNLDKTKDRIDDFINNLPFKLTQSQTKAVQEILKDLVSQKPMNRLLEGDVGSGKTVVAAIAMYATYLIGHNSVIMAPTEILAFQHYKTVSELLAPFNVKIGLVTGSSKKQNQIIPDVLIGTHALISNKTKLSKVGLVIIDEQQRFGVEQRSKLREKVGSPHVLTMTATPIPRTIALTLYSDLDLSIINELPLGRIQVKTWVVPLIKRSAAYIWIRKKILSSSPHQQAFIVCPLIEISESIKSVKAAVKEFEYLKHDIFSDLKLGLLHGRMKTNEKNKIIDQFKNNKIDILVSTPVVEVGIDIPYATIMMIEASERYGLAQLHQLRGRVGRNNLESFCLLFSESDNLKAISRIKLLEKIYNGPQLAEYDLKLRGSGEIFGTNQHGHFFLKIANISDLKLFEETKHSAESLMSKGKGLSKFPLLREKLQKYTIRNIAPD